MHTAYVGLGANLGDRGETMREALRRMAAHPHIKLEAVSSFYETPPWGKTDQPPFLNAAARVSFDSTPQELLRLLRSVEDALGRVRREHWGARTIDLDILHVEGVCQEDETLILPHPYLCERAFVLVPLAEIAPELDVRGKSAARRRAETDRTGIVRAPELAAPYPLELIAAVDAENGIGRAGGLLTDCPADMAHFRAETMGHIVVMGRRTMESLPGEKPLAGRENVVLSRIREKAEGFRLVHDLPALWHLLGRLAVDAPRRIFAIGGAACYRLLLPYAHRAHVTRLPGSYAADRFLPPLEGFERTGRRPAKDCVFEIYDRI
nr:2-amino-4-hydroxy-6-hydroxymethyldihydropteridine diphosphokinase [Selenomonas sp. F0473]